MLIYEENKYFPCFVSTGLIIFDLSSFEGSKTHITGKANYIYIYMYTGCSKINGTIFALIENKFFKHFFFNEKTSEYA